MAYCRKPIMDNNVDIIQNELNYHVSYEKR